MKAIKSYIDSDSDEQKRSSVFEKKINWGDTAELAIKKMSPGIQEKNKGVTPSVAAPGVTHPSDATVYYDIFWHTYTSISFLSSVYSTFFILSEMENQLKLQKYSGPVHRAQTAIVQLCRNTLGSADLPYSDQPVTS